MSLTDEKINALEHKKKLARIKSCKFVSGNIVYQFTFIKKKLYC